MSDNLWGDLAGINAGPRAPIAILREQDAVIAAATRGLMRSVLAPTAEFSGMAYSFSLFAPALSHTVELFAINHNETLYPLRIWPKYGRSSGSIACPDEQTFRDQLSAILNSGEVRAIIIGLIAQSKAVKA